VVVVVVEMNRKKRAKRNEIRARLVTGK